MHELLLVTDENTEKQSFVFASLIHEVDWFEIFVYLCAVYNMNIKFANCKFRMRRRRIHSKYHFQYEYQYQKEKEKEKQISFQWEMNLEMKFHYTEH